MMRTKKCWILQIGELWIWMSNSSTFLFICKIDFVRRYSREIKVSLHLQIVEQRGLSLTPRVWKYYLNPSLWTPTTCCIMHRSPRRNECASASSTIRSNDKTQQTVKCLFIMRILYLPLSPYPTSSLYM